MKTKPEILRALREMKADLARQYGVRKIALFGSYARGDQQENSDVDIMVEVDPSIGLRFVDLAEHIEQILGVHTDVISRGAIRPRHWEVIREELIDVA